MKTKMFRRWFVNDPIVGRRWLTVRRRTMGKAPSRQGTRAVLGYDKRGAINVDEWLKDKPEAWKL